MHPTRNDLPESTRSRVVELLNARLADALDLATQLKQAHWNVKGPQFIALHGLFDKVHDSATEWVDMLAERAVQLGGTALGTARIAAARSSLAEYPTEIVGGRDHLAAVAGALAAFGRLVRQAIDQATALEDAGSADLFTEISRGSDESLWFVEAHLMG